MELIKKKKAKKQKKNQFDCIMFSLRELYVTFLVV